MSEQEFDQDVDPYFDQRQVELNRKVAEKAESDPEFRAHLMDDPESALASAGLGDEAKALAAESAKSAEEAGEEVAGHAAAGRRTWYRSCYWWRYGYLWHQR
jgi:hypothetical protein